MPGDGHEDYFHNRVDLQRLATDPAYAGQVNNARIAHENATGTLRDTQGHFTDAMGSFGAALSVTPSRTATEAEVDADLARYRLGPLLRQAQAERTAEVKAFLEARALQSPPKNTSKSPVYYSSASSSPPFVPKRVDYGAGRFIAGTLVVVSAVVGLLAFGWMHARKETVQKEKQQAELALQSAPYFAALKKADMIYADKLGARGEKVGSAFSRLHRTTWELKGSPDIPSLVSFEATYANYLSSERPRWGQSLAIRHVTYSPNHVVWDLDVIEKTPKSGIDPRKNSRTFGFNDFDDPIKTAASEVLRMYGFTSAMISACARDYDDTDPQYGRYVTVAKSGDREFQCLHIPHRYDRPPVEYRFRMIQKKAVP